MQAKCTDDEFVEIFRKTGGHVSQTAKLIGITERSAHSRRRSIEDRRGLIMVSNHRNSPDYAIEQLEYPDWQHIEIKNGLLVVGSDWHLIPGHKSVAHRAFIKFLKEHDNVKAVIDNGDLLDFASISRHHRIGWDKPLTVKNELEWAGDCLEEIRRCRKGAQYKRCMGNHDQRFSGHISNNLGAYEGVIGFALQDHISGWPVSWAVRVNEDELEVTHRWKSGKHAVYLNAVHAGMSYATGHLHSQKIEPVTDLRGDRWGVDVGTMAHIYNPLFRYLEAKPRDWRSGFAVFRFVDYKLRQPELVRVVSEEKGLCEFRGMDFTV